MPKGFFRDQFLPTAENFLYRSGGILTGFLTLHADPTADLHAATKQYVDDQVAGAGGSAVHYGFPSGHWFGGTGEGMNGVTSIGVANGAGRLQPLYVGQTVSWSTIGMQGTSGVTSQSRLLVYELDPLTLFPTALLHDAGLTAVNTVRPEIAITLTTTAAWLGLAMFAEVGANAAPACQSYITAAPGPYGWFSFTTNIPMAALLVAGLGPGAPAFGSWALPGTADNEGSGVYLKVA